MNTLNVSHNQAIANLVYLNLLRQRPYPRFDNAQYHDLVNGMMADELHPAWRWVDEALKQFIEKNNIF